MDIFEEAGVPPGVINLISGDPVIISNMVLDHPQFAGLHFTGSTEVFKHLWQQIGNKITHYRNYPRIVDRVYNCRSSHALTHEELRGLTR